MELSDLHLWQWLLGLFAALLIGLAKTGLPGVGILVVTLMAIAFDGRPSVGILLPLLICADCFAVFWYRRHTHWDTLLRLLPWVAIGVGLGGLGLWQIDRLRWGEVDIFSPIIGLIVLSQLLIHWLRQGFGDRLVPQGPCAVRATGIAAGVATTMANAAGPIMSVYLAGRGLAKQQFMGTNAWFFLLLNTSKIPVFVIIASAPDSPPLITPTTLTLNAILVGGIIPGVYLGRWLLPRLSQTWFLQLVVWLAAAAAIQLLLKPILGW